MNSPPRTERSFVSDLAIEALALRRLARALVGADRDADDLVQDAWLSAWTSRDHGDGATARFAGLIRSLAFRRRRGEARRRLREAAAARPEALPSAADTVARVEVTRRAVEALDALAEPYRTTLVLRYLEDVPAAEIARRTGVPEATVRSRTRRGLERMRAALDTGEHGRTAWLPALVSLVARGGDEPVPAASAGALLASPLVVALTTSTKLTYVIALTLVASLCLWLLTGRTGSPRSEPGQPESSQHGTELTVLLDVDEADAERRSLSSAEDNTTSTGLGAPRVPQMQTLAQLGDVRVHARVLTKNGLAQTGAKLLAAAAPDVVARSGSDGCATLTLRSAMVERLVRVAPDQKVLFHVSAPGHTPAVVLASLGRDSDEIDLGDVLLPVGCVVRGRVTTTYGIGVPDALVVYGGVPLSEIIDASHVELAPSEITGMRSIGLPRVPTTRTNVDGTFRFDGVPVGYGVVWARSDSSHWARSAPIGLRAGEVSEEVVLGIEDAQGLVIAGHVLSPDGAPVAGAQVNISRHGSGALTQLVNTDHQGRFFCVANLDEPKDIRVGSLNPDWDTVLLEHVLPGTRDIELRFAEPRWLTLVAHAAGGAPIMGAAAVLLPLTGSDGGLQSRSGADADPQGRIRLRVGTKPFRVRVTGPGYRDALLGPFDPAASNEALEVLLDPVPALSGQVLTVGGSPAAGARVSLHREASLPREGSGPWTHGGWPGDGEPFEYRLYPTPVAAAVADGQGRFRLPLPGIDSRHATERRSTAYALSNGSAAPGTVSLALARLPKETRWYVHAATSNAATVTSGPHTFDGDGEVELELRLPMGGVIDGRLEVGAPRRPSGWTMYATDGLAQLARASVAEDGAFRFEHLHAGAWQIAACEPGQQLDLKSVGVPAQRVPRSTVDVRAGASIEVTHRTQICARARVVGRLAIDGAPPGAWRVDVTTTTHGAVITTHTLSLDPDGAFEVDVAPTEQGRIRVLGKHKGTPWQVGVNQRFEAGENHWTCDLASGTLRVAVDPSVVRSSSASYSVAGDDGTVFLSVRSASDGSFGPFSAPAGLGTFEMGARPKDSPALSRVIELAPGASEHVDLR